MSLGSARKKDMRRLSVYLEERHYRFLDEHGVSKSKLIRDALDEFMENHDGGFTV